MATYNRLNEKAKHILDTARTEAANLGQNCIGTEHLLLALLICAAEDVPELPASLNPEMVRSAIRILSVGGGHGELPDELTPNAKKVLDNSYRIARQFQQNYVTAAHLWLALLDEEEGVASRILNAPGIDRKKLRENIARKLAGENNAPPKEKEEKTLLDQYGIDLTEKARCNELDPVIGRDRETERIIQILSRRTKNNPVLIGEPGVGKTAVAEGLAEKIICGQIPETLVGKRLISLDTGALIAGTKFRGEFEDRLTGLMREVKEAGDVILFIDELQNIVGMGKGEGTMDAANILKPMLSRGELQCVGATTTDEYRKHIEKDAALSRRFQPVMVEEPTEEEAVMILKGLRDKYEAHHRVRFTDEALEAAVKLSARYVADRCLPDKAVDLMDEAGSRVRIASFTPPPDLKEHESSLQTISREKQEAIDCQDYERAAALRDDEHAIKEEMERCRTEWENKKLASVGVVNEEDIAAVVSAWTGIPVQRMTEAESERLLRLEEILHRRVVGQTEAVSAVCRAIRRARAGLKDPKRPIGSFLFLGPTGVGKTELCRALGEAMFGDENALIRLDMSEYMEKHTVSRMVGAPPGYVGYEEGGQLTEAIRRRPYSVVLFDEIEKAHPDVFNMLLQVLEDGRLTDNNGRTVSFRNCIIVMTSNAGAQAISENRVLGFGSSGAADYDRMRDSVKDALKRMFKPEFLNRIDETVIFHALTKEEIRQIAALLLEQMRKRLNEKGVQLSFSSEAVALLADGGFDEKLGARPLRREIQRSVEDSLSEELIAGKLKLDDSIRMYVKNGKIAFKKQ